MDELINWAYGLSTEVIIFFVFIIIISYMIFFFLGTQLAREDRYRANFKVSFPQKIIWGIHISCIVYILAILCFSYFYISSHPTLGGEMGLMMVVVFGFMTIINSFTSYLFKRWNIFVCTNSIVFIPFIGRAKEATFKDITASISPSNTGIENMTLTFKKEGSSVSLTSYYMNYNLFYKELKEQGILGKNQTAKR